jgi:hypothetical protein
MNINVVARNKFGFDRVKFTSIFQPYLKPFL